MNANQNKKEMTEKPSREDVHEQREQNQQREGVVKAPKGRPPAQSLVDEQRADWEGMGQPQSSE